MVATHRSPIPFRWATLADVSGTLEFNGFNLQSFAAGVPGNISAYAMWKIRLFGHLEVQREGRPPVRRFRSRSAASVLAYLALHIERAVPREELCEAIWPEHDPELSRSSLRTVLFSLRKQFECSDGDSFLGSDRSHVWIVREHAVTDYAAFVRTFKAAEALQDIEVQFEANKEAVALVQGTLLAGHEELWATPHQIAFEEMYSQCIVDLIGTYSENRRFEEAAAIGKVALTLSPYREDIHVALIRSLNKSGRSTEAIRQFEVLERLLDEQWGESPSIEAVRALESTSVDEPVPRSTPLPPSEQTATVSYSSAVVQTAAPVVPLPSLSRRIFGREHDVRRLSAKLAPTADEFDRLYTITGAGGCGKTVLAICTGHSLRDEYCGRVAFVDLGSLRDPNLIVSTIAESLKISSPGSSDVRQRLVDLIAGEPQLLILDNAEHLVPSISDLVDSLLQDCPRLRILVTSRQPLGLESERAFPVSTLESPQSGQDLSEVACVASVMLYVDRAQAIRPDFAITTSNAPAIIELCRRLEGLPLAIELAVAQTSIMSPSQVLLKYGDHSFQLKNKLRDAVDRHRSLESVLDWSYGLLSDEEKRLFRALGTFRGSFTLEAAHAVVGTGDTTEELDTLIKTSVVERLETVEGFRFRLLAPIHSYAAMKAVEHGEDLELRERHLRYFVKLVQDLRLDFSGPKAGEAAFICETEHENLRQIADWAIATKTFGAEVCDLIFCLTYFVGMRGHFVEWTARIDAVLKFYDQEGSDRLAMAKGHSVAGNFKFRTAVLDASADHFRQAVNHFHSLGDMANIAGGLCNLGMSLVAMKSLAEAETVFEDSLESLDAATSDGLWNPDMVRMAVRGNLATLYRYKGRHVEALDLLDKARTLAESQQIVRLIPPILLETAQNLHSMGKIDESLKASLRAESLSESLGITTNIADARVNQAWCHLRMENAQKALETALTALPWALTTKSTDVLSEGLTIVALALARMSEHEKSEACWTYSLRLRPNQMSLLSDWQSTTIEQSGLRPVDHLERIGPDHPELGRFIRTLELQRTHV